MCLTSSFIPQSLIRESKAPPSFTSKMQNSPSKNAYILIVIALSVTAFNLVVWTLGNSMFSVVLKIVKPQNAAFTVWKMLAMIVAAFLSAWLTEIYSFKRIFPVILLFATIWFITGAVTANFFAIELAVVPVILTAFLTHGFVQLKKLWIIDKNLTNNLVSLASEGDVLEGRSADMRIESSIRLLETIFPVSEIIIFYYELDGNLKPIGRTRKDCPENSPASRQNSWKNCILFCEKAIDSRTTQIQNHKTNQDAAQIALPLICDDVIIGVLFIDVKQNFQAEDRNLLESFSSQLGRNLQRQELRRKELPHNTWWNSFSTQSLENRLDITNLVRGIIKEQSFSAVAGSYLLEAHAIAYLDGTLAYMNQRMKQFANLKSADVPQTDLFNLLERFKTDVFNEPSLAIRRVMQTGDSFECELNFPDQEKTLGMQINLVKIPVENIHSTAVQQVPACFLISFRNISAVKENEKLRSDMTHLMSHELRTPITSIQGFAELLLLDEETLSEDSREYLRTIAAEAQRAGNVLSNFLSIANLQQSDKQEVIKTSVEINEIVREVIEDFSKTAKQKRIRIVECQDQEIPPIAADKGLLTKAISHLMDNAIRYSPERTSVMISTILETDFLRVEVEDRGYGIPKGEVEKIWQKFYRVAHDGVEKQENTTGLGLSLVKEIIEHHKGEVAVQSVEGRGSRFSFRLPRL